jgi:hypothetical protein
MLTQSAESSLDERLCDKDKGTQKREVLEALSWNDKINRKGFGRSTFFVNKSRTAFWSSALILASPRDTCRGSGQTFGVHQ